SLPDCNANSPASVASIAPAGALSRAATGAATQAATQNNAPARRARVRMLEGGWLVGPVVAGIESGRAVKWRPSVPWKLNARLRAGRPRRLHPSHDPPRHRHQPPDRA